MPVFYKINGTLQPKIFNLVCDGISITLDIPFEKHKTIKENIKELSGYAPKGSYNISGSIPLNKEFFPSGADKSGHSDLILQCDPREPYLKYNMRFLRVEWNPSYVNSNEVEATIDLIAPGLFKNLIFNGTMTKIDLAVDIAQVDCDNLLCHYPKSTITDVKSKTGRTVYIGGAKSPIFWRIYNKQAQIKEKNNKKAKALKEKIPGYPLTRIELSIKHKCNLLDLHSKTNFFAKLTVAAYTNFKDTNDGCWDIFLDSCRLRGASAALFKIKGTDYYDTFKARLINGKTDWWDPDKIWSQLPSVIANIANIEIPVNDTNKA